MSERRRVKQTRPLEERLAEEARRLREEAELLPHGPVRDAALRRAGQAETGSQMPEYFARFAATAVSRYRNSILP